MNDKHIQIAYAVAKRYSVNGMNAEDLRQEAILFVLGYLKDDPNVEEGHLVNKLRCHFRNLYSRCRRATLKLKIERPISEDEDNGDGCAKPGPLAMASSNDMRDFLERSLPPREFRVIELTYWENTGDKDIAADLGISRAAVRKARSRGQKKIREWMSQNGQNRTT